MRVDERTIAYAQRRRADGKTPRETMRCIKRHITREIYRLITDPPKIPDRVQLRQQRLNAKLTLEATANANLSGLHLPGFNEGSGVPWVSCSQVA